MLIGSGIVAMALTSATVQADQPKPKTQTKRAVAVRHIRRVIYVDVTGSRIPERVVTSVPQTRGAAAVKVYGSSNVRNTGATSVASALAMDPDINVKGATGY
jgi:hypothetical protein